MFSIQSSINLGTSLLFSTIEVKMFNVLQQARQKAILDKIHIQFNI